MRFAHEELALLGVALLRSLAAAAAHRGEPFPQFLGQPAVVALVFLKLAAVAVKG
jgi:hypothetical protein